MFNSSSRRNGIVFCINCIIVAASGAVWSTQQAPLSALQQFHQSVCNSFTSQFATVSPVSLQQFHQSVCNSFTSQFATVSPVSLQQFHQSVCNSFTSQFATVSPVSLQQPRSTRHYGNSGRSSRYFSTQLMSWAWQCFEHQFELLLIRLLPFPFLALPCPALKVFQCTVEGFNVARGSEWNTRGHDGVKCPLGMR